MRNIPVPLLAAPVAQVCFPQEIPAYVGVGFQAAGPTGPGDAAQVIKLRFTTRTQLLAASRLAVSINYMVAHLSEPMKIATLSAMAGLSMSRFFELFKSATNDTPLNWLIRARMRWAGELLENSDLRIKEIADQVGYEDQLYFSRLFKSVYAISPSQYRAQKQLSKRGSAASLPGVPGRQDYHLNPATYGQSR